MRGGFVAHVGDPPRPEAVVEAVGHLRWHRGNAELIVAERIAVALLGDADHGPAVDAAAGRTIVCHGAAPAPLEDLVATAPRFAALEVAGTRLRAVVDHLGQVPLFLRETADGTWVSTEVWPLASLGPVEPNPRDLVGLAAGVARVDATGWHEISRVPAGCIVEFAGGERRLRRWWDCAALLGRKPLDRRDAAAAFRDALLAAIAAARSPGCAVSLSGGLDSAAVALAPGHDRSRQRLVHVTFPTLPECDERRFATACADALGLPLEIVEGRLDPWDPTIDLHLHGVAASVLPTGVDEAALPHLARNGVSVLLDGHDGDGVLGATIPSLGLLVAEGRLRWFGSLAERHGWRRLLSRTLTELVPAVCLRPTTARGSQGGGHPAAPFLRGVTAARGRWLTAWRPPHARWRHLQLLPVLPPATHGFAELEMAAAAHGIDLRHPFADRRLVELLLGLAPTVKLDPERSKWLLREALADVLPPIVRDRRDKVAFNAVLERRVDVGRWVEWLLGDRVRLPDVDYEHLAEAVSRRREAVPAAFVVHLVRAHHLIAAGHP